MSGQNVAKVVGRCDLEWGLLSTFDVYFFQLNALRSSVVSCSRLGWPEGFIVVVVPRSTSFSMLSCCLSTDRR